MVEERDMRHVISLILGAVLIIMAVLSGSKAIASMLTAFTGLTIMISAMASCAARSVQRSFDRMISYDE